MKELTTKGNAGAQFQLGRVYHLGEKVEQDYQKTFEWYSKASEDDNYSLAQYDIGEMYYYGKGTGQNIEEAIKWLTKAVKHGDEDANELLKKAKELLKGDIIFGV